MATLTQHQRDEITDYIAEHGYQVTDDGKAWHVSIPWVDATRQQCGHETVSPETFKQAQTVLGY